MHAHPQIGTIIHTQLVHILVQKDNSSLVNQQSQPEPSFCIDQITAHSSPVIQYQPTWLLQKFYTVAEELVYFHLLHHNKGHCIRVIDVDKVGHHN